MKLDAEYFACAVEHITTYGDTDIFPYPFELKFLQDRKDEVASKLSALDLNQYQPMSLVESLVPKSKFGFRAAHQPFPIDTAIYTALVLRIFNSVEEGRDAKEYNRAFSYRKTPGLSPSIFHDGRTYRDWLSVIEGKIFSDNYSHVIRTDISDYYSRIYRHRLENILDSLSGESQIVKKIEGFISDWRSRQSFGLPVGSNASRLLAEAALNDTDMGLISEGYEHTRYVDDIVIFVKKGQDPYAALGYLAKQLTENEGLSLNIQKTRILAWDEFKESIGAPDAGDDNAKEEFATEKLFWAAYGQDEIDQESLEALMLKDLRKELEDLLNEPYWDMGQIRIVLHAMRLVKNEDVAHYIRSNLSEFIPFAKDVCLLIEEFIESDVDGFENMGAEITNLLLSPRIQPLDCARAWFLELGVRKHISFSAEQIRKLDTLSGTLDIRQLHLIRWRARDLNFFRARKSRFHEIQSWAQPSFIFGASCLPKDEYAHWLRSIKSRVQFPLGKEFVDWCGTVQEAQPIG
ncbi:RNA-directed DNA polymerase [Roseovarius amoyensis]|uniref:RNA-directed DNA polymerase n=1 Tax=Roseovarius amoyensis TaxID=2211448 RepID=UPI0013A6BEFE|nr:RNA-directed DNA polymerase [Roseovarius amoyensis]